MQYLAQTEPSHALRAYAVNVVLAVLLVLVSGCGDSEGDSRIGSEGELAQRHQALQCTADEVERKCECNPRCGITFCVRGHMSDAHCEDLSDADGTYEERCLSECGTSQIDTSLPQVGVPTFADRIAYLFDSADPLQTGTPWWIGNRERENRLAVITGRIFDTAGEPLSGVAVSIRGTNDYGTTESRYDGDFELAVDCNEELLVDFELDDHLAIQRRVTARCEEFNQMDGVIMTPQNAQTTTIDLSAPVMTAGSGVVTDADGEREAVAFFADSITAVEIEHVDGTTSTLSPPFDVRITEYTVGAGGLAAMPGELPPATAYTYAAELSVEDPNGQITIGASDTVKFLEPDGSGGTQDAVIPVYVDNFLEFPTGERVPAGFYDREQGSWKASNDGCVIEIVGEANGEAEILGLSSEPEHPCNLSLSSDELETLWTKYGGDVSSTATKSLWRVPVPHFSPWDFNWPWGPPEGAVGPDVSGPKLARQHPEPCRESGSIIECENRILSEFLPLAGTGTALVYNSGRQRGYEQARKFTIPLMETIPSSPETPPDWIEWELFVAGKSYAGTAQPADNLSETVTWDSRDAQGRTIHGAASYRISVSWVYEAIKYEDPQAWEQSFGGAGTARISSTILGRSAAGSGAMGSSPAAGQIPTPEIRFTRTFGGIVDGYRPARTDFGQWTLADEHVYDATANRLIRGDGGTRRFDMELGQVRTIAGDGTEGPPTIGDQANKTGIAVLMDFALDPSGIVHLFSATAATLNNGDQTYHFTAPVNGANRSIAAGELTNVYLEQLEHGENGRIYYSEFVKLMSPGSTAQDWDCAPLKVLEPDGSKKHLVGAAVRSDVDSIDYRGSPTAPCFNSITDIERGPDGAIYLLVEWARPDRGVATGKGATDYDSVVAMLTADGIFTVVAGGDVEDLDPPDFSAQDEYNATGVALGGLGVGDATDIEVDSNGNVFIAADALEQILKLRPDGMLERIAGNGARNTSPLDNDLGFELDGRDAAGTDIDSVWTIALDRQDRVYFASGLNGNSDINNGYAASSQAIYRLDNGTFSYFAGARGDIAQSEYGTGGKKASQATLFEVKKMEFSAGAEQGLYVYDDLELATGSKIGKLRMIREPKTGLKGDAYRIPSSSGSLVYAFDERGLHLRTEDAVTGVVLKEFERDTDPANSIADGTLLAIQKSDGSRVEIDRTTSSGEVLIEGLPPGVSAGNGFEYTLNVGDGLLLSELTRPDGVTKSFSYGMGELLYRMVDFRGYAHDYSYDIQGNLKLDDQPIGSKTLSGSSDGENIDVTVATEEGVLTDYSMTNAQSPLYSRTVTYPGGAQRTEWSPVETGGICRHTPYGATDEKNYECRLAENVDGTETELHFARDPRPEFEALIRYVTRAIQTLPDVETQLGHSKPLSRMVEHTREENGQLADGESVAWKETSNTFRDADGDPGTADRQQFSWELGYDPEPEHASAAYSWISLSPEGRRVERFFDADARLVEVKGPGPWSTHYVYKNGTEQLKEATLVTDTGLDRITTFAHDSSGRIDTIESPDQQVLDYAYPDASSSPEPPGLPDYVEHTDKGGSTLFRKVDFEWDNAGGLTRLDTPRRDAHWQEYSPNGLLEKYTPPVVGTSTPTEYLHDFDNRLEKIILPNRFSEIRRTYDNTYNHLSNEVGTQSQTERNYYYYLYSQDGTSYVRQIDAIDGGTGRLQSNISFDWNGELLRSTTTRYGFLPSGSSKLMAHTYYDGDLSLKSRMVKSPSCGASCTAEFIYSADGLLTQSGPLKLVRDEARDGLGLRPSSGDSNTGLLKETTSANPALKTETQHQYDDFGQPKLVHYDHDGASFDAAFEIQARDQVGRILESSETIEGLTKNYEYHYTAEGFLDEVYVDGVRTYSYSYDSNGNRTEMWDRRSGMLKRYEGTYDAQDRVEEWKCDPKYDPCLSHIGFPSYEYDYRGDLTLRARRRTNTNLPARIDYQYDEWGNINRVDTGRKSIDYFVDPMNRRIGRMENQEAVTRAFVWSAGNQILAELDANGNLVSRFIYATKSHVPDLMYSMKEGSWQWYRIVTDWRGSVRVVVSEESGNIVQRLDYTPFGRVTQDTNPFFQPFGFAGGIYDPDTGLVRFGARDYDPFVGRWTNKDPIRFAGGDTNLYAYVGNDPVNFIDSSGLWAWVAVGAAAGVAVHYLGIKLTEAVVRKTHPPQSPAQIVAVGRQLDSAQWNVMTGGSVIESEAQLYTQMDNTLAAKRRISYDQHGEWDEAQLCASRYAKARGYSSRSGVHKTLMSMAAGPYEASKLASPLIPMALSTDSQNRPPSPMSGASMTWADRGMRDAR